MSKEERYTNKVLLILLSVALLFSLPSIGLFIDEHVFFILYKKYPSKENYDSIGRLMFDMHKLFLYDNIGIYSFYPDNEYKMSLYGYLSRMSLVIIPIILLYGIKIANTHQPINGLLSISLWVLIVRIPEYIINYNWPWFVLTLGGESIKIGSIHFFVLIIVIFTFAYYLLRKYEK